MDNLRGDFTAIKRKVQGGVYAQVIGKGRVWVEYIRSDQKTAAVRYDPGEGMRSRISIVPLDQIDFGTVDGWKKI